MSDATTSHALHESHDSGCLLCDAQGVVRRVLDRINHCRETCEDAPENLIIAVNRFIEGYERLHMVEVGGKCGATPTDGDGECIASETADHNGSIN